MPLRFLLDEDIHPRVAQLAWELEVDAVSVHELRCRGRTDHDQLELAASQERVLVTRNRADYLYWTREFYRAGRPHAGLLLLDTNLPNDPPETIARALRRWVRAHAYDREDGVPFGPYHVDFLAR